MAIDDLQKRLFVSASEKYGDKYIEHLLEQYKIYLSSIENLSDRRQKSNEFFLGLNTALVAVLGFVFAKLDEADVASILALASVAGMAMCYLWYRIVRSYKGLSTGKFAVVHAIEERLPLALYDTEWKALGEGKNKKVYWPFSHIELYVPQVFIIIYAVLFASLFNWHKWMEVLSFCS